MSFLDNPKEKPKRHGVASEQCRRKVTQPMKIEKYFDKQLKRERWRIDVTVRGQRFRQGKFDSFDEAQKFIIGLQAITRFREWGLPSPLPPTTVQEFLTTAQAKSTRPLQLRVLAEFARVVDGNKNVRQIKRVDLAAFYERLLARQLKPGTIAHYKHTLIAILKRAGEWFEDLDDWTPPKFPKTEKAKPRDRVLMIDELIALFREWRRSEAFPRESEKWRIHRLELYDLVKLMLLTGARREELESLTPGQIDWRENWINLYSGKVQRSHLIPLNPSARELLKARIYRQPMFDRLSSSTIHYIGKRVSKAANLTYGRNVVTGWTPHDFRRRVAVWIESHGIAYSAIKATLGHKRHDVTATYTPAQIEELRRASDLLEKLWREIDEALETPETTETMEAA